MLGDIDEHFGGNYLDEETLLAYAREHGYNTAAVGKLGPTLIQDVTQRNPGGNPKRKTERPSAEKMLKAFCNLTLYFLPDSTIGHLLWVFDAREFCIQLAPTSPNSDIYQFTWSPPRKSLWTMQKMIDSFPLIKVDYADYQILPLAPYPAFAKKSV